MTLTAFILVLTSAFLHAGWNFLGKVKRSNAAYFAIACYIAALIWLPFFIFSGMDFSNLPRSFWCLLGASIFFESLYYFGLANAYRVCDISMAYPMARSLPVLSVAVITFVLGLGKTPSTYALTGMCIIFLGCIFLPLKKMSDFRPKTYFNHAVFFIVTIAIATTGYTIVDSSAVKLLRECGGGGNEIFQALSFLFMIELGIGTLLLIYAMSSRNGRADFKELFMRSPYPVMSGVFSSGAYALILIAMNFVTNVSYIQAFRQMSLPMGVFAGIFILKEECGYPKLVGVALILTGLILAAF